MTGSLLPASFHSVGAIVWDFDGVIADTEPCQARAYEAVLLRHGHVPAPGWFEGCVGGTERSIWSELISRVDPSASLPDVDALMRERVAIYLQLAADLSPSWFVTSIITLDIEHHIVSAGNHDTITSLLDRWRLTTRFSTVRASDSPTTPPGQPKGERLRDTLVELGAAGCAVIEDGAVYLELARTLGAITVGVQHSLSAAHHDVDFVVDHRNPHLWTHGRPQ
jgi:phosphoglycolate phosphatase-like HAD superfamily hydrolase